MAAFLHLLGRGCRACWGSGSYDVIGAVVIRSLDRLVSAKTTFEVPAAHKIGKTSESLPA